MRAGPVRRASCQRNRLGSVRVYTSDFRPMKNVLANRNERALYKLVVDETTDKIVSVGKILDISLDVITTSYIEEEIRTYSPVYKVKSALISFSERFSQTTNLMLVLALIGLTIGVVWLFVQDVMHLISGVSDSNPVRTITLQNRFASRCC